MLRTLILAPALAILPLTVIAAELPREGTDDYTTHYITSSFNTMKLGDRTVTVYDTSGITTNDKGGAMFNNMATRCLGMRDAAGGEAVNRGACVDTDSDGDQVFSNYEAKGLKGTHVFVGGTGKYAGLSGSADYTTQPVKNPDGRSMNIVPHKATWKLPSK
ncbi:hypothetical protein [Methylobacterium nigriterrae]|uniref:hypothetical protein n=1 Tax=Methylobacterium nigriterrae TaxID=3127512 RepID=UPI003013E9F1